MKGFIFSYQLSANKCSLDTQRIMAESEIRVDEVSGGSESSELDCSLDLFFEEEEGPAIPRVLVTTIYRYGRIDTSRTWHWTLMRFPRLQRVHPGPETKL